MYVLTLRSDKPEAEIGIYKNDQQLVYQSWQAHRQLAETIHLKLKDLLESQQLKLGDIGGIVAYQGPGSFTGLRIGLSVTNALAVGLQIPIVGTTDDNWIAVGLQRLSHRDNEVSVMPEYGAPVHITQPRR